MRFVKIEAAGNDYIYVDLTESSTCAFVPPAGAWVRGICDRHFGVGADGVVYVLRENNAYRMIIYNADGSRARICGNALRSIAHYLDVRYRAGFPLSVNTDSGVSRLEKTNDGYAVDLGVAALVGMGSVDELAYSIIDVGNLHAVCMTDEARLTVCAEKIRTALPDKALNVETYRVGADGEISMAVDEYGTGRTLACGSGACAVCYDACLRGLRTYGLATVVRMAGGMVRVSCGKEGGVRLMGSARIVFWGDYDD